jgi:hypothetical protein
LLLLAPADLGRAPSPALAFGIPALQSLQWRWQAAVADHLLCQLDRTMFAVCGSAQVPGMLQAAP